jgi:phage-related holin
MKEQSIWAVIGAVVLPAFEYLYGAGEPVIAAMVALTFFIALDWLSGIRAANKDKSYASRYGIDGIFRSFFMLLLPAGGHLLDQVFNLPGIVFGALAAGLLYHVIKSMTANAIRAGWGEWLPLNILDAVINWVGSELDKKIQRAAERGGNVEGTDKDA